MTDVVIALTVVSGVVACVSLFGFIWLRVERRQARETAAPKGQEKFVFPTAEVHEFAGAAGRER